MLPVQLNTNNFAESGCATGVIIGVYQWFVARITPIQGKEARLKKFSAANTVGMRTVLQNVQYKMKHTGEINSFVGENKA